MKTARILLIIASGSLLMACAKSTHSISNSGYINPRTYCGRPTEESDPAFRYRGELSELDVLGISKTEGASDADIRRFLESSRRVRLRSGQPVLLIQSGAMLPDPAMISELSRSFRVVPFSGVPPAGRLSNSLISTSFDPEGFSRSLRLAAARGGTETILCYWGLIEREDERLPTKTLSWLPVMNWALPDEKQHLRIRLKIAIIDVRTGSWAMLSPAAVQASRLSISPHRAVADQRQVESAKTNAYQQAVAELIRLYTPS